MKKLLALSALSFSLFTLVGASQAEAQRFPQQRESIQCSRHGCFNAEGRRVPEPQPREPIQCGRYGCFNAEGRRVPEPRFNEYGEPIQNRGERAEAEAMAFVVHPLTQQLNGERVVVSEILTNNQGSVVKHYSKTSERQNYTAPAGALSTRDGRMGSFGSRNSGSIKVGELTRELHYNLEGKGHNLKGPADTRVTDEEGNTIKRLLFMIKGRGYIMLPFKNGELFGVLPERIVRLMAPNVISDLEVWIADGGDRASVQGYIDTLNSL